MPCDAPSAAGGGLLDPPTHFRRSWAACRSWTTNPNPPPPTSFLCPGRPPPKKNVALSQRGPGRTGRARTVRPFRQRTRGRPVGRRGRPPQRRWPGPRSHVLGGMFQARQLSRSKGQTLVLPYERVEGCRLVRALKPWISCPILPPSFSASLFPPLTSTTTTTTCVRARTALNQQPSELARPGEAICEATAPRRGYRRGEVWRPLFLVPKFPDIHPDPDKQQSVFAS